MVRTGRFRFRELELLVIPSLLILCGLVLVLAVEQNQIVWRWVDVYIPITFIVALLIIHVLFTVLRFRGDQVLLPTVAILSALGLVMLRRLQFLSDSYPDLEGVALKQTIWVFVGLGVMLLAALNYRWIYRLRRYKYTLILLGILLMVGLFVPGLGTVRGGARLWYDLRVFLFQPSEIVKIILVLFFAAYLDERRDLLASEYRLGPLKLPPLPYLAPMLAMWGVSLLLMVALKDLGSALLFFGIFLAMLYAVTGRALYVWILGGLFVAGAFVAFQLFGHVQLRVDMWLYPFREPRALGYGQIEQSLFALGSGGVYGSGLGYGFPALMPQVQTDMIFSAIGEELGLVGSLAMLGLYMLLVFRGFHIALRARRGFDQLVAIGITTIFGLQTFIIVAGNIKLIPLTGITLPFIAYGGSSTIANFLMAGLLLGLSGFRNEESAK